MNERKRILFIDDERDMRELVKMRLEANGYEVLPAHGENHVLNKAVNEKPDLILLDVVLPKGRGFDVCQELKATAETRHIPLIVVSASFGRDFPERCRLAGADDFIFKPFNAGELLKKIGAKLSVTDRHGRVIG
ncbi:MAG: response regulator [Candidatus Omnitrophica bacterium]|nr:response regulator [Candidatus Omnitrophota bacterium]